MTKTTYPIRGILQSNCTCYYCPACEIIFTDESYPENCECGAECTPAFEQCYGECWEQSEYDFEHNAFIPWCEANNTEEFAIYGSSMGWTRSMGHTGRLTTFDELLKSLTFHGRGDFILRWSLSEDNKTLTIVRSSHDEMGAVFEVVQWNEGDDE